MGVSGCGCGAYMHECVRALCMHVGVMCVHVHAHVHNLRGTYNKTYSVPTYIRTYVGTYSHLHYPRILRTYVHSSRPLQPFHITWTGLQCLACDRRAVAEGCVHMHRDVCVRRPGGPVA